MSAEVLFWIFSGLIIGTSLIVLMTRNVVYAAIALMAALLGVAVIFVLAQADFLAVTQIMIYVGGIVTLMIFGVMLSKSVDIDNSQKFNIKTIALGLFVTLLISGGLLSLLNDIQWGSKNSATVEDVKSTTENLGLELLTNYILPFEVIAILLLVALVGAAFVASKVLKK